jgi:hypothetical protein
MRLRATALGLLDRYAQTHGYQLTAVTSPTGTNANTNNHGLWNPDSDNSPSPGTVIADPHRPQSRNDRPQFWSQPPHPPTSPTSFRQPTHPPVCTSALLESRTRRAFSRSQQRR